MVYELFLLISFVTVFLIDRFRQAQATIFFAGVFTYFVHELDVTYIDVYTYKLLWLVIMMCTVIAVVGSIFTGPEEQNVNTRRYRR